MTDMTNFLMDRIKTLEAEKANYKGMILKMLNDVHPDSACESDFEIGRKWDEALNFLTRPTKQTEKVVVEPEFRLSGAVHEGMNVDELIHAHEANKYDVEELSKRINEMAGKLNVANKRIRQFGDSVRTVKRDDGIYFSLEDVCNMLDLSRHNQDVIDMVTGKPFSYSHLKIYSNSLIFISRDDVKKLILYSGQTPRSTLMEKSSSELNPVIFLDKSFFIDSRGGAR